MTTHHCNEVSPRGAITVDGLNSKIDGEPRIQDLVLAKSLGFSRPRNVRDIIRSNRRELEGYSGLRAIKDSPTTGAGRPATTYWLNEPQAILICMFSRTDKAEDARRQIIDVFMEWRRGKTIPVRAHDRRTSTKIEKAISLANSIARIEDVANRLGSSPRSSTSEHLWSPGDEMPVTMGDLLDILIEARRRLHGGHAVSTRYEINLIGVVRDAIAHKSFG